MQEKALNDNSKQRMRCERGNALVLTVIAIAALIGASGLVLDWGRSVWTKTRLQKAADAGALAGASFLPSHTSAQEHASLVVSHNYTDPEVASYIAQGNTYTVRLTDVIPTYFMRIFGSPEVEVYAEATAVTNVTVGGLRGGAFPFAIINPNLNDDPLDDFTPWNYGRKYVIGYGEDNIIVADWVNGSDPIPGVPQGNGRGWRGALDLKADGTMGGAGADDVRYCMEHGWPGVAKSGDAIPIKMGNMTSIDLGRDAMLGENPVEWEEFDPRYHGSSTRVALVPIIHLQHATRQDTYTVQDFYSGAAWDHTNVVVDGFAPFFILTVQEQGDVDGDGKARDRDWVTGYYIPPVYISDYLPPNEYTEHFGLYASPRLSN